jgi:DNA/RNA endonuclease YhcR with UshA esterase domain
MNIHRAATVLLGLSAVVLVLGADRVAAQRGMGRGQGPAHYDVATEMTVTGTVAELRQVTDRGPWTGTHVTLKTAAGTLELALGPSRFMTQKKYSLAKGDQVDVIGAKAQFEGHDVLIVREIKKGSDTMTFRDAKGFPMWSGRAGR